MQECFAQSIIKDNIRIKYTAKKCQVNCTVNTFAHIRLLCNSKMRNSLFFQQKSPAFAGLFKRMG